MLSTCTVRSLSVSVAEGGADSDEVKVVSVEEGPVSAEEETVGAGSTEVRPVSVEGAGDSADAKSSLAR